MSNFAPSFSMFVVMIDLIIYYYNAFYNFERLQ